jgi:hypothetical protein
MTGPIPDDIDTIVKIDKNDPLIKGLKKGGDVVDSSGRTLRKISDLDEFVNTPKYREIYGLVTGKSPANDVIHHLIEKGSRYAKYFKKEVINAPKSLLAIPKGDINSVLHLSDIRKAWDDVYSTLDRLVKTGMTDDEIRKFIQAFADKSKLYLEDCLEEIFKQEKLLNRPLTKPEIEAITSSKLGMLK